VHLHKKQRGVATLVTAVVLMLAVFGVTYFMSQAVINEQQLIANDIRGSEAFQAAQSGIEFGKIMGPSISGATVSPDPNLSYVLTVSGSSDNLILSSQGQSRDDTAERLVTFSIAKLPAATVPPAVPVVAKGGVETGGGSIVVNNESKLTIWTGLDAEISGSVNTYVTIDGVRDQLSTIKTTGGGANATATYGSDVVVGDINLANKSADAIVKQFFGSNNLYELAVKAEAAANTSEIGGTNFSSCDGFEGSGAQWYGYAASNADVSISTGDSIKINPSGCDDNYDEWLTNARAINPDREVEDFNFGITGVSYDVTGTENHIGTPDNPVMIVVNGEVELPSNTTIYGIVVAEKISVGANTFIMGGLVGLSDDPDAVVIQGGPRIILDETVMKRAMATEGYGPVISSWRDW